MPSTPALPSRSPSPANQSPARAAGIFLSVIIPAYNEEKRLGPTLEGIYKFLRAQSYSWEILVVDDGSADGTARLAEEAGAQFKGGVFRVHRQPHNMGKGAAIKTGMTMAQGQFRLFTDADNSTPIEEVEKLLGAAQKMAAGVAIGSRALRESNIEKHQPWFRECMGRVFNLMVRIIVLGGIRDTQCGFKLFSAEAAQAVFPAQKLQGFSFDVEILALARRKGFRIAEVPIRWIDEPHSRVNPLSDSARMFLDLLRIRFGG